LRHAMGSRLTDMSFKPYKRRLVGTKWGHIVIGAKRGGTRKQRSQQLFELAEIFGKIVKLFINNEYILCKMKKILR
jgi:hypothetical protein